MAVRKDAVISFGGFDTYLGPGLIFPSAEDHDIALRALIHGGEVYLSPEIIITHHGFRNFQGYRSLTRRDWFALGEHTQNIFELRTGV